MEVGITDFRNNASAYFDKVFFQEEEIILTRRNHRVKITRIDENEENFNNSLKTYFNSEKGKGQLKKMSNLLSRI